MGIDGASKIVALLIVFLMFGVGAFLVRRNAQEQAVWEEREKAIQSLKDEQGQLGDELKSMSQNLSCQEHHECRIVGYGLRTCDGYNEFLIYSVTHTHQPDLLKKLSRYNEIAVKLNDLDFKVPSCGVTPPKVGCIEELCQAI